MFILSVAHVATEPSFIFISRSPLLNFMLLISATTYSALPLPLLTTIFLSGTDAATSMHAASTKNSSKESLFIVTILLVYISGPEETKHSKNFKQSFFQCKSIVLENASLLTAVKFDRK